MELAKALGLRGGETVAFVGAGGKTSAMFTLAHQLPLPVLLTTTTHMGAWQAPLADEHYILTSPGMLLKHEIQPAKTVLLTGLEDQDARLAGLDAPILDELHRFCRERGYSLLIEADGARLRALKAPADYEPVIPPWVDQVVVMAGLDGLARNLTPDTVHRPEIFAQLADLKVGDPIEVGHLIALLGSAQGGIKGIPHSASRSLFLNQAEGERRIAQSARVAQELCGIYDRVLIGSLQHPGMNGPIFSAHSKTAGIILAAGGSERLGQPKQLLDWYGTPFIVQVVKNALTAGLEPLIVVTGADQERVKDALAEYPARCLHNPDWVMGQSTSLKVGLAALSQRCDRVMLLLSDQPQVSPLLIRQLIEKHNGQREAITAPMMRERRGNPVLFGRETFQALKAITGDQGGRAVFNQFKVDSLSWIDDRVLLDVDQPGDYEKLIAAYNPA